MENWKDIKGYEGRYQVSSYGRVKSLIGNPKIIMEKNNGTGHFQVALSKEGKITSFLVHRLVAEAFIPNPDNLPCVNHIDENPHHNFVENLEWITFKDNLKYGTAINRKKRTLRGKKDIGFRQVVQWSKHEAEIICVYDSLDDAVKSTGLIKCRIKDCCEGKRKTTGGFRWEYKD